VSYQGDRLVMFHCYLFVCHVTSIILSKQK
jgi:hypothetical protein